MGGERRCYMVVALSVLVVSWWLDGVAAAPESKTEVEIEFKSTLLARTRVSVFYLPGGYNVGTSTAALNAFRRNWQDKHEIDIAGGAVIKEKWELYDGQTYYIFYKPVVTFIPPLMATFVPAGSTSAGANKWVCTRERNVIRITRIEANQEEKDG